MASRTKKPLPKTEGFQFDPKLHVYTLDGKPLMGVTSVLGVVAKPALIAWAANMACDHIRDNFPSFEELTKNPKAITELIEVARKAYAKKRDTAADAGTDLHAIVEEYVGLCIKVNSGNPTLNPGTDFDQIKSFYEWAIRENIRFLSSEQRMYHRELGIAGTADLVFEKGGKVYIGDVKTYKKIWDRLPFVQCAAYGLMHHATTGAEIAGYCIIRIKDNEFETMWSYDREGDTEAFLSALKLYKHLKNFAR